MLASKTRDVQFVVARAKFCTAHCSRDMWVKQWASFGAETMEIEEDRVRGFVSFIRFSV
jgi:hypothetical protein